MLLLQSSLIIMWASTTFAFIDVTTLPNYSLNPQVTNGKPINMNVPNANVAAANVKALPSVSPFKGQRIINSMSKGWFKIGPILGNVMPFAFVVLIGVGWWIGHKNEQANEKLEALQQADAVKVAQAEWNRVLNSYGYQQMRLIEARSNATGRNQLYSIMELSGVLNTTEVNNAIDPKTGMKLDLAEYQDVDDYDANHTTTIAPDSTKVSVSVPSESIAASVSV